MAELYDRARPSYPAELFEAVFSAAGLEAGRPAELCESGAGTGKATRTVGTAAAIAGWSLTCVEPDPAMARVLRGHLDRIPGLEYTIELAGLEQFAEAERARGRHRRLFDLLYAAQSWHWVAPERRYLDAADLLADGGTLALIWNVPRPHPPELQRRLDEVYGRVGPRLAANGRSPRVAPPASPEPREVVSSMRRGSGDTEAEIESSRLFTGTTRESRPFVASYDTSGWLEVLRTHSDHRILPADELERVLGEIGEVIDDHGGRVDVSYDAVAVLARRLPRQPTCG